MNDCCYLPDKAGLAVPELVTLPFGERLLREAFVLGYEDDEDELEHRLCMLGAAIQMYIEDADALD